MPAELIHLGPGSALPEWLAALDAALFGHAWGPLDEHEHAWILPPMGFARWKVIPALGEAELLRIGVSPEARGQGEGRRLLRASTEAVRKLGVAECRLEVRVSNAPARGLYEAEGWQCVGIRKSYYRNGEDAALYQLTLS